MKTSWTGGLAALTLTVLTSADAVAQDNEVPPPEIIDLARWPDRRPEVVLPPAWAFGVLYGGYTNQAESLEKIDRLIDLDLPIDAYWIDSWFWDYTNKGEGPGGYIDFVGDREAYPDPGAMWDAMRERSIKSGVWVWDRIIKTGNEDVWNRFMDLGFLEREWIMKVTWHTDGVSPAAFVSFDNPKAAFYWQERLRPFFDMGLDFLKIDAGATLPYMEAAYDATARYGLETEGRGFILSHANMVGPPPHLGGDASAYRYPTKWTGDASIKWTQDNYPDLRSYRLGGLREQLRIFSTKDDKGHYPFLTMDTGGYSHGSPDDELFRRWAQFSSFTPVMCVFGAADKNQSNTPYTFDDAAVDSFREHTHLRMRLFPYIYSYAHLSRLTGENIIRPVRVRDDQYLFGDAFMVAPVYEPGAESRHVYLPEGAWINYWTGERHDQGRIGTTRRVSVTPDKLPLFVKEGAIVPMREYARAVELGTNDTLDIHLWPRGTSRFHLVEDDGTSNDYLRGRVALTELTAVARDGAVTFHAAPVEGSYDGMPDRRTFRLVLHGYEASSATVDGRPLRVDAEADAATVVTTFDPREGSTVRIEGARRED